MAVKDKLVNLEDLKVVGDAVGSLKSAITEPTRNIYTGNNISAFINTSTGLIASNSNAALVYAECTGGKSYTVSKTAGKRFIIGTTVNPPDTNVAVSDIVNNGTASSLTLTASQSAQYIVAFVWLSTADTTITKAEMLASVQIEEGTSPTAHVPCLTAVDVTAREGLADENNTITSIQNTLNTGLAARPTLFTVESMLASEHTLWGAADVELQDDILAETHRAESEEARIEALFTGDVTSAVNAWLTAHPESVINLTDHSVSAVKLAYTALNYVTPEMFGAAGDGVTDDSAAIETASTYGPVFCGDKTYYIGDNVALENSLFGGTFNLALDKYFTITDKAGVTIENCSFYAYELPASNTRGNFQLYVTRCNNARIVHCHFQRGVSAIYIDRCNNVIVDGNLFTDYSQLGLEAGGNGYGVLLVESNYVKIINNHFKNVARHAVYISHDTNQSTYNTNIDIRGNSFVWDDTVLGAAISGYESTINVRPAKNVYVRDNYFQNQMNMITFNRQNIYVEDEEVFAPSENIYITDNIGDFKYTTKRYGIIFFSSSSDTDTFPSTKNIHIERNHFVCEYGYFICADNFDGLYVMDNEVKLNQSLAAIVGCKTKRLDLQQDLYISRNRFTLTEGYIFATYAFSEAADNLDYGDFEFSNNTVTGLKGIGYWPSFPDGSQSSFETFVIANNRLEFVNNRDYWSSPAISAAYISGNIVNAEHGLYIGTPTKLYYVDPVFTNYSGATSNPTDAIAGNINVLNNNNAYIKTHSGWVQISTT